MTMTTTVPHRFDNKEAERVLRLQCLAAVESSIIQKERLTRAQEIYDFVTADEKEE